MNITIRLTNHADLKNVQALWADPAVMCFVGFPEGLHETMEHLEVEWLPWVQCPPRRQHYSVYEDDIYCGESFYDVDDTGLACMDIKLLPAARGKGIAYQALSHTLDAAFREGGAKAAYVDPDPENHKALALYRRLGFQNAERPEHLDDPGCPYIYLEMTCENWLAGRPIRYRDIVLRDMRESDIEDEIRWNTVETEWALWDAPWEMEMELLKFDPEKFQWEELEALKKPKEEPRWGFELDTADGRHIGSVSSYLIDENWDWIRLRDVKPGQKTFHALGIEICDSRYWNCGLGTQALAAFILYCLEKDCEDICLQTWSGNFRMVQCAEKLGFTVCHREVGSRHVRGGIYDGLTFRLDLDRFHKYLAENS